MSNSCTVLSQNQRVIDDVSLMYRNLFLSADEQITAADVNTISVPHMDTVQGSAEAATNSGFSTIVATSK